MSDDVKYNFRVLSEPVVLVLLKKLNDSMHLINQLLYYTDNDIFVSFTKNEDELSLIVTEKYISQNNNNLNIYDKKYSVFQIIENCSEIEKVGIVNCLSKIMATNGISILYITTYNNDYILVDFEKTQLAINCLETHGYGNINAI